MPHPWLKERPLTPYLRGGFSTVNKTGSWRVMRPVLDIAKCRDCGMCWLYCPEGVIDRQNDYLIDYDYCKGCGVCAVECPVDAIEMVKEE